MSYLDKAAAELEKVHAETRVIYTKAGRALAVKRFRFGHVAECEGCHELDPDSTRERCRVHVEQTGHTVRFVIEDTTVYGPPPV
jgi:hypothetical protein